MLQPRRDFVGYLLRFATTILVRPLRATGQSHHTGMPDPPSPADPQQRDKLATQDNTKTSPSGVLLQREKEYRSDSDKLFQWVSELHEAARNTPGTQVLSVKTFKRLQEIEKLAKKMQKEVKG
jgi:hypothetical protein